MEYVLLTGVTSSIGESIAISLSEKYIIILGGRNLKEISAIKDKLNGDIHLIWHCDFTEEGVAESLILFLMTNNLSLIHI